jgi:alkylhydroperoxidase family enzyme
MSENRIPLREIDSNILKKIKDLGGKPLHLYQILTHHPRLLSAWIDFAYSLRKDCTTARTLRELMILRGAQIVDSSYEWQQHFRMALEAGVSQEKIDHLGDWRDSKLFEESERVALELMEAVVKGEVDDTLYEKTRVHFSTSEYIELLLTASFYVMVPRVLNGLQVPLEK